MEFASDEEAVGYYRGLLASVYGGRRWILGSDVLVGLTPLVARLASLGADGGLCIATASGVGTLPDAGFAPDPIVVPSQASSTIMDALRATIEILANLPDDVVAAVERFDPQGEVLAIGPFFGDDRPMAGRRIWGGRPERWRALEDKTTIDAFWDRLGVTREPAVIVDAADFDALWAATAEMDRYGTGAVWVGDSKEGFNGGAEYVRRVASRADADTVHQALGPKCDRIRVMPMLEGIPCSIHGMVFATETIAIRPCEMLVLRKDDGTAFHYSGTATMWDPPVTEREAMRALAVRIGDELRATVGYRGVFTIDGIMTERGFRPTELNPRFGGGIWRIGRPIPQLPLLLLHLAVCERDDLDWRPNDLEALLLSLGDSQRSGGGLALVAVGPEDSRFIGMSIRPGEGSPLERATFYEDPDAPEAHWQVRYGPHPVGGFMGLEPKPEFQPVGQSLAPALADVINALDEHWSLGLGTLTPAKDVLRS